MTGVIDSARYTTRLESSLAGKFSPSPGGGRRSRGREGGLIRLSVGIEAIEDLIADLDRAWGATVQPLHPHEGFACPVTFFN
ncbi:PLP-dependent transferase [Halomonas alkalisoli]|uniref:PLP-dependent transferase n=1 Tax=Halomonas alkalisoli TaxID=2907158 RepID=UPI0034E260E9